jgi:hypothetical protein
MVGSPVQPSDNIRHSPFHQRSTADALLRLVPGAAELPGSLEPPRPEFVPDDLVSALLGRHF